MKLIGLMPLRNEAWICGLSIRAALTWLDSIVLLLHECTDETQDIVGDLIREYDGGRIVVMRENGPWDEMRHRQAMLERARHEQATHIAIVDADEILACPADVMRHMVSCLNYGNVFAESSHRVTNILQIPLYFMRGSITRYHANGIWGDRIVDVAFPNHPLASWRGDNFHARAPHGVAWLPYDQPLKQGKAGVMHLWALSERQIRAKSALYKVTERLRWPEKPLPRIERMYNWAVYGDPDEQRYGTPETWTYADALDWWWEPYKQWLQYLHLDIDPWAEAECRRLVTQHPGVEKGLDLFGVA